MLPDRQHLKNNFIWKKICILWSFLKNLNSYASHKQKLYSCTTNYTWRYRQNKFSPVAQKDDLKNISGIWSLFIQNMNERRMFYLMLNFHCNQRKLNIWVFIQKGRNFVWLVSFHTPIDFSDEEILLGASGNT